MFFLSELSHKGKGKGGREMWGGYRAFCFGETSTQSISSKEFYFYFSVSAKEVYKLAAIIFDTKDSGKAFKLCSVLAF